MDAKVLLMKAREARLMVQVDGDMLVIRGPRSAEAVAQRLLANSRDVAAQLARDDAEIAWRIEAMRPQVPPRGPIPMLHARPDAAARDAPGCCWSCGEPREEGQRWICRACQAAKWAVLNEQREGVVPAIGTTSRNEN